MDSFHGLSPLQRELLREFFAREPQFVLTGGGALTGYHLHHRATEDLDLFAKPPAAVTDGRRAVEAAADVLGASVESLRLHPEFVRLLVRRGAEAVVVDLAIDRSVDVDETVDAGDGVRIHSMREIAANKLCALLGRSEIRDLVDLRALMGRGIDLDAALVDAERKDGGISPASLAWLLDQVVIPAEALVHGVPGSELARFRDELVEGLRRRALPRND
jgi:hypothetical protein